MATTEVRNTSRTVVQLRRDAGTPEEGSRGQPVPVWSSATTSAQLTAPIAVQVVAVGYLASYRGISWETGRVPLMCARARTRRTDPGNAVLCQRGRRALQAPSGRIWHFRFLPSSGRSTTPVSEVPEDGLDGGLSSIVALDNLRALPGALSGQVDKLAEPVQPLLRFKSRVRETCSALLDSPSNAQTWKT